MIGVDTNVLVRLALDDGSPEVQRARGFASDADAKGGTLFVNVVVLAETSWVLSRTYRASRAQILKLVMSLLENSAFELQHTGVVRVAVDRFAKGAGDFADCLISALNEDVGADTVSFDRGMRKLPRVRLL